MLYSEGFSEVSALVIHYVQPFNIFFCSISFKGPQWIPNRFTDAEILGTPYEQAISAGMPILGHLVAKIYKVHRVCMHYCQENNIFVANFWVI